MLNRTAYIIVWLLSVKNVKIGFAEGKEIRGNQQHSQLGLSVNYLALHGTGKSNLFYLPKYVCCTFHGQRACVAKQLFNTRKMSDLITPSLKACVLLCFSPV